MTSPPPARADLRHARARRTGLRTRILVTAGATVVLLAVLIAAQLYQTVFAGLPAVPDRAALWSLNRPPGFTFVDHNGQVIASRGPRHGRSVDLEALPAYLPRAFLAAEDRRFYAHHGVDGRSILRAAQANAQAGGVVQGGSTLTQQLAKIIFLTPEQTFRRKLQEAVLAVRLEQVLSKDEVLALYLDRVFFGESAYGVEAAARTFFAKEASQLTLSESALLAALPKAPSRLDPTNDLQAAVDRSRLVLANMRAEGWITAEEEAAARASPPELAPPPKGEGDMGYVLDLAQAQALDRLREAGVQAPPDLIVRLTVDPQLQTEAVRSVRAVIGQWGRPARARQAAMVALAPDGAVRAMVGGIDHRKSAFNRAVQAQRQPGSAFKPFVFAAALEDDVRPTDIRQDRPLRFGRWTPANYGDTYRGAVTVEDALADSVNTVAISLTAETGREKVAGLARRFGLASVPPRPGLSVALGAYETNLLELTGAYQAFQRGGKLSRPYLIEQITTARGDLLYRHAPLGQAPVYNPPLNAMMVGMLQRVIEQGTGRRGQIGRPAAGKTGTSQNHKDAWFVGFTPDWIAGVWVGNDDGRPMNQVTGGELPAMIWRRFMVEAHRDLPIRDFRDLLPAVESPETAGQAARSDFYAGLSVEFEREAAAPVEPEDAALPPAPVEIDSVATAPTAFATD